MRGNALRSVVVAVCLVLTAQVAVAAIPLLINHQGIVKVDGEAFSGYGGFRFALIDGATGNNLWTNDGSNLGASATPDNAVTVSVSQGMYNLRLGDVDLPGMEAIPSSVFSGDNVVLRIWFDDGTTGVQQLTPDRRITSAAYAFHALNADTVGGADASVLEESAEIDADIAAHTAIAAGHHAKTVDASELTTGTLDNARLRAEVSQLGAAIDLAVEVTGLLPEANIDADVARDTEIDSEIATHTASASAHHPKTIDASELTTGTLDTARLDTSSFELPAGSMVLGASGNDSALIALGYAFATAVLTATTYNNTWVTKATMPRARLRFAAAAENGVVYALGGYNGSYLATNQAYDTVANTWSTKASMPTARMSLAAAEANGVIYVIGGDDTPGSAGGLTTNEAYDTAANTWSAKTAMPTGRWGLAAAEVNGIIYAIGGYKNGVKATVEAYDTAANTWSTKASMPTARYSLGAVAVDGLIYAIGGSGGTTTVEVYNPADNTWSAKADMPTGRWDMVVAQVDGIIYAIGGTGGITLATVEAYDPTSDSWHALGSMPTARFGPAGTAVSGVIYTIGGNAGALVGTNEASYGTTMTLYVYTKN